MNTDLTPDDLPTLQESATNTQCDFALPPFQALVWIRMSQVFETLPEVPVSLHLHVREALILAYKLGLKDGKVTLGDLLE